MDDTPSPEPLRNWLTQPLIPFAAGSAAHASALAVGAARHADVRTAAFVAVLVAVLAALLAGYAAVHCRESDAGILSLASYIGWSALVVGIAWAPGALIMTLLVGGALYLYARMCHPSALALPPVIVVPGLFLVLLALGNPLVSAVAAGCALHTIIVLAYSRPSPLQ